jgi:predicted nucleic acid-binding protein
VKRIVLDASAVITLFESRPGVEVIEETIKLAMSAQNELLMSVVNWGDVYYSSWRTNGRDAAARVIAEIAQLPIHLVDVNLRQAKVAAEFAALRKLPYADAFVAALAKEYQASILTADKDFSRIKDEMDIIWTV